MSSAWPPVQLSELLTRSTEAITPASDREYSEVTVKLWGRGVVQRRAVTGAAIAGQRRFVARQRQLILSRIDARNGAVGLVPAELDGAIITNDFPIFHIDSSRLLPEYMGWMCKTASFVEECARASEGTTNRVRLQEDKFLTQTIPPPPARAAAYRGADSATCRQDRACTDAAHADTDGRWCADRDVSDCPL